MLAGPDPLIVLHMPGEHTQDESLHNLAWHGGQADRPVVPRILLLVLLIDGCYTGDQCEVVKLQKQLHTQLTSPQV